MLKKNRFPSLSTTPDDRYATNILAPTYTHRSRDETANYIAMMKHTQRVGPLDHVDHIRENTMLSTSTSENCGG
jgi:hypothetical protein